MSTLTNLTNAAIRDQTTTAQGELLTRPQLIKTDGASLTYAANVRINGYSDPLYSVPIARAIKDVQYAEPGAAVTLFRNPNTGRLEIVGFSKSKPGTRKRVAVDLDALTAAAATDETLTSRVLTLEELSDTDYGLGFGFTPLGAYALFRGSTLIEVIS